MIEREKAELAAILLNDQLVLAARRAGMADIATSVLHNIGNVLSSVNTSIAIIRSKITTSKMSNLTKLATLLQQHIDDMGAFLTKDSQGNRLPNYLSTLSETWIDDKDYLLNEVASLDKNINHIKEIIHKQNSISVDLGIRQEVIPAELIEDALKLTQLSYQQAKIKIIRQFASTKKIITDRVRLLQIMVNLIKNSIESTLESKAKNKKIVLTIKELEDSMMMIQISDNGIGILQENITKLFSHGFTTKKEGHGFGLHTSILAAREMGGDLSVQSCGPGKGATFTLILPYQPLMKKRRSV